jgi:sialate O-acetylesterase
MNSNRRIALALIATLFLTCPTFADVRLPAIFTDHAVLQREMPAPVWGWADPSEEVTVMIGDQVHKTTADDKGKWRITLEPLLSGGPYTMVVKGKNRLEVKDILAGEVWLCSGQSNMEWPVSAVANGDLDISGANRPRIRIVTVTGPGSQTPVEDFDGDWKVCSPETIADFSAVGYFFGRELQDQLDVPIGLIDNAWGGSACDAWIRRDRMEGNPLYATQLANWDKIAKENDEAKMKADYEKALAEWKAKAASAKAAGQPEPPGKPELKHPLFAQHRPANLYHGRLEPVIGYGIRGAIWYQGESNAGRAYQYREMFPLMIKSWREDWKQGDFPFYWVQLADFMAEKLEPADSAWAELREAQTMTLDKLPNTGEAVIIDIGEASDIHPRNKLEVARRLARLALARDYGKGFAAKSPRYESMEKKGDMIVVKFKDAGRLRTKDAARVQGFTIAGADRRWVPAEARVLSGNTVGVRSYEVPDPVAVRYAWGDNPVCNLYSSALLPVTPFRTDDWSGVTVDAR